MKTNFFPKLLLVTLFSLSLYSCTTDEMPASQNNNATPTVSADGAENGPTVPPGPRP